MAKKIEISDGQYDWLMAREGYRKTPSLVLVDLINLVILMEKDQAKYKAWMDASQSKTKGKEENEG